MHRLQPSLYGKRLLHSFKRLWIRLVEPHVSITDPEVRRHARLFNGLIVILVPFLVLVLLIQAVLSPVTNFDTSMMSRAIVMGGGVVVTLYVLHRVTHSGRLVSVVSVVLGYGSITVNAALSRPPHIEIAFLILLPLFGTLLFTLWQTFWLGLLNVICVLVFAVVVGDMPSDILQDILMLVALTQVFILFLAYQRNKLENDRQRMALAQGNSRLMTRLLGDLSHDFRTPLTVISTTTYLLARTADPQRRLERAAQIEGQVARLSKMMDDILTISRLENVDDITLQSLDLNDLLRRLVTAAQGRMADTNAHIQTDLAPALPLVVGNPDYLQQALGNMLENALQYLPAEGGTVTVRSRPAETQVVIEIIDTGAGIAAVDLPLIFDHFFRGSRARTTTVGGAGLGLSIARRIMEIHGGQITVESVEGQGSTFRVVLPAR